MSPEPGIGTPTRQEPNPPSPLAIIGIGCLFPGADSARAFWANIKNRVDGIGPVPETHWRAADYFDADPKAPDRTYVARGGFLRPVEFNPIEFGIAPNDLDAIDTAQLLGLVVAREALHDAGYGSERAFDRSRVSVILGVTGTQELVIPLGARLGHPRRRAALKESGVDDATAEDVVSRISGSYVEWQENSFPGLLGNVVAGRIANRLDLHGTNCVVDAACASSLSALHLAGLELQAGRADLAVTGGVDTFNDIFMYMCFSKTPALSPTGDAKPFDANGDGTILGEGLGIIVLKRLADAERDGDRVYAVVRSIGSASDGKGNAIYAPSAEGQVRALRRAYELAGISPATIELVEAHGTGTKVGDTVEASALTEVYREAQPNGTWCALGSVKSQVGHTKAAAGAAGLIKAALALHHKTLPPTIKVKQPVDAVAPGKSPFYINTEKRPWLAPPGHPRRAAVSSFGFGGSNFHVVLEEHGSEKRSPDWDGNVQIIALCADTPAQIERQLDVWQKNMPRPELAAKAAESRRTFRPDAGCRLLMVAHHESTDVARMAAGARALLARSTDATFVHSPDGIYLGRGPAAGSLGVVFPGQGSQYAGMLRDLACQFPEMLAVLADADRIYRDRGPDTDGRRLSDLIYPHAAFTAEARQRQDEELRQTDVAQPAIGAVSIGALHVLERFGVEAAAFAGHSYGELPALCAAGCFDAEALHRLSRLRGHLMAACRGGDAGAMLAVHAPLDTIEDIIRSDGLRLTVANKNAPNQAVLSGETTEVIRAAEVLAQRNLRHTRLPVAAAFHSPLVADAEGPFRQALDGIAFARAGLPVFANTTSNRYPDDPHAIRATLAGQLARPVDFVQEIVNMARTGVRTFIEVGPGATLSRLVASILEDDEGADGRTWDAFALDASAGKRSGILDLAHALGRLAARGYRVQLTQWNAIDDERAPLPVRPGLIIPICGANHVKQRKPEAKSTAGDPTSTQSIAPTLPRPGNSPPSLNPMMSEPVKPTTAALQPAHPGALAQALQLTQQSLGAFQRLQEQTAQLHRQFLENQEVAQRTLQTLVEQQQAILAAGGTLAAQPLDREPKEAALRAAPAVQTDPAPRELNGKHRVDKAPIPEVRAPEQTGSDAAKALLEIVSEKTGYPAEMLNLGMSLDADLGIDSIKRVEILSALQERLPHAPVVKPEHLGTLHTLKDVADFLAADIGTARHAPMAAIAPVRQQPSQGTNVAAVLLQVVSEKTGYPVDMLDAGMSLDADLGIDSIKRVEILSALQERLPSAPVVKPEHLGTLRTLHDVAEFLEGKAVALPDVNGTHSPFHESKVEPAPRAAGAAVNRYVLRTRPLASEASRRRLTIPGASVVWLVAEPSALAVGIAQQLEARGWRTRLFGWDHLPETMEARGVGGLILLAPDGVLPDDFALRGFRWLRRACASLMQTARDGGALFAAISQLDGAFGLEDLGSARDPAAGALAGLVKTASWELANVACKAIDLCPGLADAAESVADELSSVGPLEVGIRPDGRVALEMKPSAIERTAPIFGSQDVIVITGGARGVTFSCAEALARQRPTLVLLGRTPADSPEPAYLSGLIDEAAIKQALARHNGSMSPRDVANRCRDVLARRELRANLARLKETGARVEYMPVDVGDSGTLARALVNVRATCGAITGLVHGAGILADQRIENLTDAEFSSVLQTKVTGLKNLLQSTAGDPLKALVLFSSTTARFGRVGQAAYAAANEVMNKIAQQESRRRAGCRVVSINWGPWQGGMVTPALRKVFESEGVALISLAEGAEFFVRELGAADHEAEVIALAGEPPRSKAEQTTGGAQAGSLQAVFTQRLTLDDFPVLRSHVIDGRAVLPLALHLEWLAHAALHGNPGLLFHGFDGLRILQGVFVDEGSATQLSACAGKATKREGQYIVPVELRSRRDGQEVVHSRADIVLASNLSPAPKHDPLSNLEPHTHSIEDAYRCFLFHGDDLRGIVRIESIGSHGLIGVARTAPSPAQWATVPLRAGWLADPLVLDSSFQLAILWSFAVHGSGSLPCHAATYRQFVRSFPPGEVRIAIRVTHDGPLTRMDIDYLDHSGRMLAKINGYECVVDPALNEAFRRNSLAPAMR